MTLNTPRPLRLLLLEDNPGDARLVREYLKEGPPEGLDLDHAETFAQARDLLATHSYDAALIDLSVPDSEGIATFRAFHAMADGLPVVVLSGLADQEVALQAVQEGAQDYLMKGRVDGELLIRAVHYAIERQQLEEQRRNFVAMVSHELRNPLATILSWSEILRSTRQFNERAVDIVIDQAAHLDRLIRDLVEVAALDARQLDLRVEPVDIVRLVRESTETTQRSTDRHRIRMQSETSELIGTWDKDRVQQILDNLLTNAIKYSPYGGNITVSIIRDGQNAVIRVADAGVGLSPDVLSHLFSRFYRTETAREHRNSGLGLGLYITRSLAEAHGGTVVVESPGPGRGSTFTVTLPLDPSPLEPSR